MSQSTNTVVDAWPLAMRDRADRRNASLELASVR